MFAYSYIQQYDGENCDPLPLSLPPGKRRIVPVFHDECCFHANDRKRCAWLRDDEQLLRQKNRGKAIHVSSVILETTGALALTEEQIAAQEQLPPSE